MIWQIIQDTLLLNRCVDSCGDLRARRNSWSMNRVGVAMRFILNLRSFKCSQLLDVLKFLVVISLLLWLLGRGTEKLGYNWQWYRVPQYILSFENGHFTAGPLLEGLKITLLISAGGMLLAFLFGLTAALLRLSRSLAARGLSTIYLESIRNIPLLILLFFMYFVISPIYGIDRLTSAILALGLFEGAYLSEVFRAGILSVSKGQQDAAHSLGLSAYHTYSRIVLPQAARHMLPPLTSQAVSLVKDSALVSTIAIADLTMQGQIIIADTFLTFEIWFTVAAIYLILTLGLSGMATLIEQRFRIEH
jgi:polar amino acid transport system permease protein